MASSTPGLLTPVVPSPLYTVLQAGLGRHAARGGGVPAVVSFSLLPGASQPRVGAEGFPSMKAAPWAQVLAPECISRSFIKRFYFW